MCEQSARGRAHLYRCECHWHCWDLLSHWFEEHLGERHTGLQTAARSHLKQGRRCAATFRKFKHDQSSDTTKKSCCTQTLQSTQRSGGRDTEAVDEDSGETDTRKPTVFTWHRHLMGVSLQHTFTSALFKTLKCLYGRGTKKPKSSDAFRHFILLFYSMLCFPSIKRTNNHKIM